MDLITHILLAYGGVLAWYRLRHRAGLERATPFAAAAAAAAMAPDLDVIVSPLSAIGPLYFLQHRGATHSLLGAPVAGLAFVLLLGRLSRLGGANSRWARLAPWRWQPGFAWAILFGSWSHLLLDGIAHHGVPLAWPLLDQAYSLEVFYWIVWWLAPLSLVPLALRWRRRWDDRRVLQAAAVIVALLVILGGVRLSQKPDGAYAQRSPFEWTVAQQEPNGTWHLQSVRQGRITDQAWYPNDEPGDARQAVAAVQATWDYRRFLMASTGPLATQAAPTPAGGWNITILDTVQRFELRQAPAWLPEDFVEQAGVLKARVQGDKVMVTGSP